MIAQEKPGVKGGGNLIWRGPQERIPAIVIPGTPVSGGTGNPGFLIIWIPAFAGMTCKVDLNFRMRRTGRLNPQAMNQERTGFPFSPARNASHSDAGGRE